MNMPSSILRDAETGIAIDVHRAPISGDIGPALAGMIAVDSGAIANPDEGRMVGHYWLRDPGLAPTPDITQQIENVLNQIRSFEVEHVSTVVQIGVGGSGLGPELIYDALKRPGMPQFEILDTVDPDAVGSMLERIDPASTLVIVASKSGSTVETSVATDLVEAHYTARGVSFADHAVAITIPGSKLAQRAQSWKAIFPMFDWVGGRTSVCSAVGLVPMHLMGIDIDSFLAGASAMDRWNRNPLPNNPAAHMALMWAYSGCDSLCVIPYANRLRHLTRYLQQLIMESLGKANDRNEQTVHTGLTVFGNKGSADQHAIVQQLRDGPPGVQVHLIDVAATENDFLLPAADVQFALHAGTGDALAEVGRPLMGISLPRVDALRLGALIALYERAVGLTAELLDINAYNQPGVEAGKRAAKFHLEQLETVEKDLKSTPQTAKQLAANTAIAENRVWKLANHLSATGRALSTTGKSPSEDLFQAVENFSK